MRRQGPQRGRLSWATDFVFAGVAVLAWTAWAGAQSGSSDAWFNLYPEHSGGRLTVSIDHVANAGVQGWSFGLCHDPTGAAILDYDLTPELYTIRHGNAPDFIACEEASDKVSQTGRVGLVQAIVLAYQELLVLPMRAGGFPVLDVQYGILGDATSTVEVCNGLSGSGQPVLVALTRRGQSILPAKLPTATLSRGVKNAWFNVSPPVSDSKVTFSIESSNADIQGWSVGVCHDPSAARVTSFGETDELVALLGGETASYYKCEEASAPGREGVIQVLAFLPTGEGALTLPVREGGFPVLQVAYEVLSESLVEVCGGLQGSGQPVDLVLTAEGASLSPSKPAGATLVPRTPASQLSFSTYTPESSEVVNVMIATGELRIEGWSFALCHTAEAAQIVEFDTSPEVDKLRGGEPPQFVQNEVVPAGPFVAMTQKVILGTPESPVQLGPFPDGLPVLGIRYRVLRNDTLKFCDQDPWGDIRFENQVTVDGRQYVPWVRKGAKLVTNAMGTSFIRGDADLNGVPQLTDAVYTLMSLFLGSGPLPCLDAADVNDVARVDISDPIFLLRYLFLGGPPPPPPFPDPGQDLSPQTALGCERGL